MSTWSTILPRISSLLIRQQQSRFRCSASVEYVQGQSPEPKIREYFYYIDHEGYVIIIESSLPHSILYSNRADLLSFVKPPKLFLDDTRMKNFTSCFKDKPFLKFFYDRLRTNTTARYSAAFPFVSLCGRERNYIRCDDVPIVFTHVIAASDSAPERLAYAHAGDLLSVAFQPDRIFMSPLSGRVYHPCGERHASIGLVRSKLAIEFSRHFEYDAERSRANDEAGLLDSPVRFVWNGQAHVLNGDWVGECAEGRAVLRRTFE